jgi:hypothetical protein
MINQAFRKDIMPVIWLGDITMRLFLVYEDFY